MSQTPARESWSAVGWHWIKFNAVGAIGIGVQLVALTCFVSVLGINYLLATALAVETAVLHNFMWHERWTWIDRTRHRPGEALQRFLRFNLTTGALSILSNLVVMRFLVGQVHLNYLLANLISIAACSLINFLASDWFIFRAVYPSASKLNPSQEVPVSPGEPGKENPRR